MKAGTSTKGRVLKNEDGFWLDAIVDCVTLKHGFIWLGKSDWVVKQ